MNKIDYAIKEISTCFNVNQVDYEDDFKPDLTQIKGGVLLSEYSDRFKTVHNLVKHIEQALNIKSQKLASKEYYFDLSSKQFQSMTVYEQRDVKKIFLRTK